MINNIEKRSGARGNSSAVLHFGIPLSSRQKFILNLRAAWLLWEALFIFPGDRNPGMGYNECIILLNGHRIA